MISGSDDLGGDELPEIRITFSRLLYHGECHRLDLLINDGESRIAHPQQYEEKAERYREAWKRYEKNILEGMEGALGVSFYRSVIDVTLAPYFGSKSVPLIINFRTDPDAFVDVLTHELLHVLQNDNNKLQTLGRNAHGGLTEEWRSLFGDHERKTLVHIPVHALHKYIYLDILNAPKRLARDIETTKSNIPYAEAWQYVNDHDYRQIVDELRAMYSRIPDL